jgi:DNA-binding MarR family transcriptional regulator
MSTPNWLNEQEQRAWRGFLQTYQQLTALLGRDLLHDSGLSMQDYAVLVALSERSDRRMRAFELGRELTWEKSRVSHHIGRMIDRDLVTRATCPTDKRGAFIAITDKGLQAIRDAAPNHVAAVRNYFVDVLSSQELATLAEVADKVGNAIVEIVPCDSASEECDSESQDSGC